MANNGCLEAGCDRPHCAKGYCKKHWQQISRKGVTGESLLRQDPLTRLLAKVEKVDTGCWEWRGHVGRTGYGRFRSLGVLQMAHRASYELHGRAIPEGLMLDHLCRNRACVNPDHLEPVTHAENMRRGERASRTECIRGHAYDEANTKYEEDREGNFVKRVCLTCRRNRFRTPEEVAEDARANG